MPTYPYRCKECNYEFEEMQSIKAEPLKKCPKCGKDTLQRIIAGGAGVVFKGSGFYSTDYRNKEALSNSVRKATKEMNTGNQETIRDVCGEVAKNFNKVNESSKKPDPSVKTSGKVKRIV
jgi:putative FmdB family regulatory protein